MIQQQISEVPGGIFFWLDSPSDEDDIKGRPLVGSDGHLLSRALRASGLTCPGVVPRDYEPSLLGETRRLLYERRKHSFFVGVANFDDLLKCLDSARPNVLVPLGEKALFALTGRTSIDDWRGAVRFVAPDAPLMQHAAAGPLIPYLSHLKIIPTYPPARILKQYKLLVPLIADLMKVSYEAATATYTPLSVAVWLEPDLEDLARFERDYITHSDLLTLDIETARGQIVCVQIGTDASNCLVLPFTDYRQSDRSYWRSPEQECAAWEWLRRVLASSTPKLGQNFGAYDIFWLLDKVGMYVNNYNEDLRLIHHILQPELPKGLAFMGAMYTSMPRWKSDVHHGEEKRDA